MYTFACILYFTYHVLYYDRTPVQKHVINSSTGDIQPGYIRERDIFREITRYFSRNNEIFSRNNEIFFAM